MATDPKIEQKNDAKDASMELAEEAREKEWKFPSFTAEMFRGNFRWDLVHPYPEQSEEDKKIGDEFLEKVAKIFDEVIDPDEIDRTGQFPQKAVDALAEIGAFGMKISKEYGGLGFSHANYLRALAFMGSYCQNTVTWVSAHQSIGVPQPLKIFGTEEQKKKFLPRLAKGAISAFALTEEEVGSDPAKMAMTAELSEDGQHYILNGSKLWCTNGMVAEILVVMCKTGEKKGRPEISAFIVESDMPGYEAAYRCDFMGLKGIANGVLTFNNVKVPKENMIGNPGDGLRIALTTLNTGRLGLPAATAGGCKQIMEAAKKWCTERVQWGVPIGKHQSIAKMIANISADTFAMDSINMACASFADQENADIRLEAAAAKYFATETGWRIIDDFVQVRGGRGYETANSLYGRGDYPFPAERALRDARIGRIFEGSSQVMHLIMAREALDTHFSLVMPILMPKPGQKESKFSLMMKAAKFYAVWYPKLWLPSGQDFNVKHLNQANRDHLSYINKTCKRLARKIFHTMAKYQQKLETEQLLLANFVEVGVDLFAMAAALSNAENLMAKNPNDETAQELADLFCKNARQRIEANFKAVGDNHNTMFDQVAKSLMEGKYGWFTEGLYDKLPISHRTPPEKPGTAETEVQREEIPEPVAK